jgi:hypothetical protein
MKEIGNADRQGIGRWKKLSRRDFSPAISKARMGHASLEEDAILAKVRRCARFSPQPFQRGAPLYNRSSFKLNRAAALAKWCGLGET